MIEARKGVYRSATAISARGPCHSPMAFHKEAARLVDLELATTISAYLEGDPAAADRLSLTLTRHASLTVRSFLGEERPEGPDIVQDTVLAILAYLQKKNGFSGDLVNFTIAVTRNRCRNLLIWQRRHPGMAIDVLAASWPWRCRNSCSGLSTSWVRGAAPCCTPCTSRELPSTRCAGVPVCARSRESTTAGRSA
jgi:hypothetical protein